MQKVLNAPISESFKILNGDYEEAVKKLEIQGIKILEGKTIKLIAKDNKTSPFKLVSIITTK